jgi:hypothetical protein
MGDAVAVLGAAMLVMAVSGVVIGTAALSAFAGNLAAGRGGAVLTIAARRLQADPWAASRSLAALLAAVCVGSAAVVMRSVSVARLADEARSVQSTVDPFYARAYDLVELTVWVGATIAAAGLLVALAEQVTTRRRSLAALVAMGTPRGVLVRASLAEIAIPLVPGVLGALATGVLIAPLRQLTQLPWAALTQLGGGAIALALLMTLAGLLPLRHATSAAELRTPA